MSGVILENGEQWEHCNACGGWCLIDDLYYEEPSEKYEYGRDLCPPCHDEPSTQEVRRVAVEEERVKVDALINEKIFPTTCGHGARMRAAVYRFVGDATSPEGAKVRTYCSEACAERGNDGQG